MSHTCYSVRFNTLLIRAFSSFPRAPTKAACTLHSLPRKTAFECGKNTFQVEEEEENGMGLFDKMFGRGASQAQQQRNGQQRFDEIKQKY